MIHLDTNILIDLGTAGCPHLGPIWQWLRSGEKFETSAIAWSEFCNGPHSRQQKEAVFAVLEQRVTDFSWQMGEQASRLFHYTGRKRGSHADCMIAAAAMLAGNALATRNVKDFEKFVPLGLTLMPVATVAG
jgi:predicted nucleic acid-binding protein